MAARVAALRSVLLDSVSPDDLRAVVAALVERAKAGDVPAIREVLDRTVGKPPAVLGVAVEAADADGGPAVLDDATRRVLVALLENPVSREVLTIAAEAEAMRLDTARTSR